MPIAAPNICGSSIYNGRSIFVDFDYNNKTDIAIPKPRVGASVNEQILVMDINLKRTKRLSKKRFEDFRNNFYDLV